MTTTESPEVEILRARLERLERRMRVVVAGWVLSAVVFVLLGVAVQQAVSQPEVLRARRIEVVDAAGRASIMLGVTPDGKVPLLLFFDATGETRGLLGMTLNGGLQLRFNDAAGRARIVLATSPDRPEVVLTDATGRVLFRAP